MQLDLKVRSRTIITLDPRRPTAQQFGILNGRIVGFDEEISGLSSRHEEDFGAAVITPGLIDAHCHTAWWGINLGAVDLSTVRDLDHLYAVLSEESHRLSDQSDSWVNACGFNQENFGGRFPGIERLDEITGHRSLYIRHSSGHSAITNTSTLERAGIAGREFPDPAGGVVVRDRAGNPTGLLEEEAQSLIQNLFLPYSVDRLVSAVDSATAQYAEQGITSFTDAGIGGGWIGHSPAEAFVYSEAQRQGRLHARAQLMPVLDTLHVLNENGSEPSTATSRRGLDLGISFGFGDDFVQLGHVKVFLDGSLLGATAAVTEAFCGHGHESNKGYLLDTPQSFRDSLLAAYRAGWPLAIHAIGDAAIDVALDIIEAAQRRHGTHQAPCRIEHFAMAREDQVVRAAELGVAVTPQASFIGPTGDQLMSRVGAERTDDLYRGRSIVDSGAILAGSSDSPVVDNNVRRGMQSAVERVTSSGVPMNAGEAITAEEALRSYTEWAAIATGQIEDKGTLECGKLADFTVFSDTPLSARQITQLEVIATFVGGVSTFDSRAENGSFALE